MSDEGVEPVPVASCRAVEHPASTSLWSPVVKHYLFHVVILFTQLIL